MKMQAIHGQQRGVTMIGFLFVALLFIIAAAIGMKVIPAYIEFYSMKNVVQAIRQDPGFSTMSSGQIRDSFSRRANTAYVTVVKASDLDIDFGRGGPVVTVQYAYRTHLIGNVSLVLDFFTSTDPDAQPAPVE